MYPECPSFAASIHETHSSLCATARQDMNMCTHIPVGQTIAGLPSYYVLSCLFQAQEIRRWRPGWPVQWGWYISPSILSPPNEPTKKGPRSFSSKRHSPCRPSLRHLQANGTFVSLPWSRLPPRSESTVPTLYPNACLRICCTLKDRPEVLRKL